MGSTEQALVHLLDAALRERTPDAAMVAGVDWDEVYRLAQAHRIEALLLDTVCALPEGSQPPDATLVPWQQAAMMTIMAQALVVDQLHRLLEAFEANAIRAVVLKGAALKLLYPQPDLRTMSDADLLVAADTFDASRRVMQAEGFSLLEQEPGVDVYAGPEGLRVELHERLFDKAAYGFLSRLDEPSMFPIDKTERRPIYGGDAWVFPPQEHALFMLCHMAKHMITTGFGLRQTADFMLFVEANDAEIDWAAFWQETKLLGLSDFASALLTLCDRHLSLKPGRFRDGMRADAVAADALLIDLLDAGVFGKSSEERTRSAAVVYRAVGAKDADTGRVRRALFPSADSLKAPYLYARRHPVLLPVAWVHRWIRYGVDLLTGRASHRDTAASLDIADDRLRLLKALGLRGDGNGGR